jgi:protein O-mannosyl-transferase
MTRFRCERIRPHLGPLLLLLAVFAVYGRILGHEFIFNWDDYWYVTGNEDVRGISWRNIRAAFSSYYMGNYAPVQIVSYMVDYALWGLDAGGFLCTNLVIHALNGLLVYRLLFRLHGERLVATVGAALYLLHPVQVESVAWVSQRKNLLSMFFFLVAWEWYIRYRETERGQGRYFYGASLAAFVLSMLAKSMTVVMPVLLVMYDLSFPQGGGRLRLKDKVPFLLGAVAVTALAVHSEQPGYGGGRTGYHGGTPVATFFTMLPVFCRYLWMLVWPGSLSAEYDPTIRLYPDAAVIGAGLLLAGVALLGVKLYRSDRRLGFWVLFFWVGLLPLSQIVPMLSMINDRYLYLPLMGVAALAGAGAVRLRDRLGEQRPVLYRTVVVLPLALLAVASWHRAGVWKDPITLWSDAVERTPGKPLIWGNLAEAYHAAGPAFSDRALQAYERALALDPQRELTLLNLGVLYCERGDFEKGYALLARLVNANPGHVMGWAALGNVYLHRKDYAAAEEAYRRALALQPDAVQVVTFLGNLALAKGEPDRAREYYGQVEAAGGDDPEVAFQLSRTEALAGHREEALAWLERAMARGFREYDKLAGSNELAGLKADPRFARLLGRYFPERGETR